jgi:hypothetical protein
MAESSILLVLGIVVLAVGAVAVLLPVRSMKPRGQDEQKFGEVKTRRARYRCWKRDRCLSPIVGRTVPT